jgi:hypothetical protein
MKSIADSPGAARRRRRLDRAVRESLRDMSIQLSLLNHQVGDQLDLKGTVEAYVAAFAAERDENGRRLVVRNGYRQPREVLTSAGAVGVTAPRVNDKRTDPDTGERKQFSSAILPPWARKTPKITEVLPLLYLHGLSTGDFVPALGQFLGSSAGLSAAVITIFKGARNSSSVPALWATESETGDEGAI